MSDNATLTIGDSSVEFPAVEPSEGNSAFDIAKLRSATGGHVTYDP
ncbi:citrate (Si)-synthase, partial [Amycolatopsis sp. H6(2020)]|nr:citrate (Si)-synthase [Amycolatopsis sp. H6(2020)]